MPEPIRVCEHREVVGTEAEQDPRSIEGVGRGLGHQLIQGNRTQLEVEAPTPEITQGEHVQRQKEGISV